MTHLTVEQIDAQIAQLVAQRGELVHAKRREALEHMDKARKFLEESSNDQVVSIISKVHRQRGMTYGGEDSGMRARIGKRNGVAFIHLTGTYANKPVDKIFWIGDTVEESSYNLRYLGTIEKITEKCVTVKKRFGGVRRMDLYSFAWRNHNFNLEQAVAENHETSMYI